jgi:hypothetical protein
METVKSEQFWKLPLLSQFIKNWVNISKREPQWQKGKLLEKPFNF